MLLYLCTLSPIHFSVYGRVVVSLYAFSHSFYCYFLLSIESDPRRDYILEEPRPYISFVLFSASTTSPPLVVLRDPNSVEIDMKRQAKRFFQEHVSLDPIQKSIQLPGLLRVYWTDFGGHRSKVLKMVIALSSAQFQNDIKPYISGGEGAKPRVEFAPMEWKPMFIL